MDGHSPPSSTYSTKMITNLFDTSLSTPTLVHDFSLIQPQHHTRPYKSGNAAPYQEAMAHHREILS